MLGCGSAGKFYFCHYLRTSWHRGFDVFLGLPDDRYFTAKLAEAGKRPVFRKSVPQADVLKINNLA